MELEGMFLFSISIFLKNSYLIIVSIMGSPFHTDIRKQHLLNFSELMVWFGGLF